MGNLIELEKDKYVIINGGNLEIDNNIVFIDILNISNFNKNNNVVFSLNFDNLSNFKDYKRVIKNIEKIKKIYKNKKNNLGIEKENKIIIGIVENYDKNNHNHRDIISAINIMFLDNEKEQYEYIYDKICEYLDNEFIKKNLCDFKDDKCAAKRDTNCTMGCCHNFDFFIFGKMKVCKYLKNKSCSVHCISCKLFTCDYLKKQGVEFKINDILLANYFLNFMQKIIIKTKLFTPREKILKRILFFNF